MVILTDIYAASETPLPGISSALIVDVATQVRSMPIYLVADTDALKLKLHELVKPDDILLLQGAGDITEVAQGFEQKGFAA